MATTSAVRHVPMGPCSNAACSFCEKGSNYQLFHQRITEARRALKDLEAEELKMNKLFNAHHDPVTSKLPLEIISEIFVAALAYLPATKHDEDPTRDWCAPIIIPFPAVNRDESVVKIASVCTAWSRAASAIPALWTSWEIDLASPLASNATTIQLLERALQLSGNRPLKVTLICSKKTRKEDPSEVTPGWTKAISPLFRRLDRWLQLRFKDVPSEVIAALCANAGLSKLQRIHLGRGPAFSFFDPPQRTMITIEGANITHLHTANHFSKAEFKMSYANLTHFRTSSFRYEQIFDVLRVAPMITHLIIDDIPFESDEVPIPKLRHDKLQYLEIDRIIQDMDGNSILASLHLPSLIELRLNDPMPMFAQYDRNDPLTVERVLPKRFVRGCPHLASLTWMVLARRKWSSECREVFMNAPSLKSLTLAFCPPPKDPDFPQDDEDNGPGPMSIDTFLKALTHRQGKSSGFLLPNLISLSFIGKFILTWKELRPLFASGRSHRTPPLKLLSLSFWHKEACVQECITRQDFSMLINVLRGGAVISIGTDKVPRRFLESSLKLLDGGEMPQGLCLQDEGYTLCACKSKK